MLHHGSRENVRLVEVPSDGRASIIRRYLEVAPGGRPHIRLDRSSPVEDFERVAPEIQVFRITTTVTTGDMAVPGPKG